MKYALQEFNLLDKNIAATALFNCCGSTEWVNLLMTHFPFQSEIQLFEKSRSIWYDSLTEIDYLEAFTQHPKIGDVENLKKKFANTQHWAGKEQAGMKVAQEAIIKELAKLNTIYFDKFGYIFIVCATGKSAEEMLQLLANRISHNPSEELRIAMGEQFKITLIRLKKLLKLESVFWKAVSQITTHVLDTSIGKPGEGICIKLKKIVDGQWQTLSLGITNEDGRITDLLPAGRNLVAGNYQMSFDTTSYFKQQKITGFYPQVDIHFTTFDETHYHIPLLINPFGYSTYRGS